MTDDWRTRTIGSLKLPVRAANCIMNVLVDRPCPFCGARKRYDWNARYGSTSCGRECNERIGTLDELVRFAPGEMLRLKNFGLTSLRAVEKALEREGLTLGMDPDAGAPFRLTPDGREPTPGDRFQLYRIGVGDGAKGSAKRHAGHPDYEEGWRDGSRVAGELVAAFGERVGYRPSPLRGDGERKDEP